LLSLAVFPFCLQALDVCPEKYAFVMNPPGTRTETIIDVKAKNANGYKENYKGVTQKANSCGLTVFKKFVNPDGNYAMLTWDDSVFKCTNPLPKKEGGKWEYVIIASDANELNIGSLMRLTEEQFNNLRPGTVLSEKLSYSEDSVLTYKTSRSADLSYLDAFTKEVRQFSVEIDPALTHPEKAALIEYYQRPMFGKLKGFTQELICEF